MSKIGKLPVEIPDGVTILIDNNTVLVTGPKGNLSYALQDGISVQITDKTLVVIPTKKDVSALFGLTRALIANMVRGVTTGFEKKLELTGVGYRAQVMGNDLSLSVGYSHLVKIPAPEGIKFVVADNSIVVSGIDKALIGDVAAKIRSVRPPEPYKGKGIRYAGEHIRRKAGKAAKAVGGK